MATALIHTNAAATGLEHRALQAGEHDPTTAATLRLDLALGGCDLDVSATRLQIHTAFYAAYFNGAATGFGNHVTTDVIDANISATALQFYARGNSGGSDIAAPGLDLRSLQIPRNIDDKIIGAPTITPVRLRHNPRRVSLDRCGDPVRIKFMAGLLFRGGISLTMNDVCNTSLRSTLTPHRSRG